jgi:hypothetical protein
LICWQDLHLGGSRLTVDPKPYLNLIITQPDAQEESKVKRIAD